VIELILNFHIVADVVGGLNKVVPAKCASYWHRFPDKIPAKFGKSAQMLYPVGLKQRR